MILFQHWIDNLNQRADLGLIYAIHCTQNNRFYIGMTVVRGCKPRKQRQIRCFVAHLSDLRNQRHCCEALQHDWNQYGEAAFSFNLLEVMECRGTQAIRQREAWWHEMAPNLYSRY